MQSEEHIVTKSRTRGAFLVGQHTLCSPLFISAVTVITYCQWNHTCTMVSFRIATNACNNLMNMTVKAVTHMALLGQHFHICFGNFFFYVSLYHPLNLLSCCSKEYLVNHSLTRELKKAAMFIQQQKSDKNEKIKT